ncbi:hypothetical protein [Calothrix sp. CCY 0018]|uniref:hypothetical protein n=1 Tax=Calothrix sp. CCY 0018 TaxID=3103864 RepID=UPI0039C6252D
MNILYALEPDLCLINPQYINDFTKDIILPKYFYTQLQHLSLGNFQSATEAANLIINSLIEHDDPEILIFKTVAGGTVYFIDEKLHQTNLDTNSLLDCYLFSLLKLSENLEAKIVFLTSSPEIIRKCQALNFEVAIVEEYLTIGESWLQPEMLLNFQANCRENISEAQDLPIPQQEDTFQQIEWQDITTSQRQNNIHWMDILRR